MECTICSTEMDLVASEQEVDFIVETYWCFNCGTLYKEKFYDDCKELKRTWAIPSVSKAKGHRGRKKG